MKLVSVTLVGKLHVRALNRSVDSISVDDARLTELPDGRVLVERGRLCTELRASAVAAVEREAARDRSEAELGLEHGRTPAPELTRSSEGPLLGPEVQNHGASAPVSLDDLAARHERTAVDGSLRKPRRGKDKR